MATVKVTRYCPTCKGTTKHDYNVETGEAKCLSAGHSEWWKKGQPTEPGKVAVTYPDGRKEQVDVLPDATKVPANTKANVEANGHLTTYIRLEGWTSWEKNRVQKLRDWPVGSLKVVSREAYNAIRRARGYDHMTPTERLEAAKAYDVTVKFEAWKCEVARLLGRNPAELDTVYGDMPRDQWESGTDPETAAAEIRAEDEEHA